MTSIDEIHRIEACNLIIGDDASGASFMILKVKGREPFKSVLVQGDGVFLVDGAGGKHLLEGQSVTDAQFVATLNVVVIREVDLDLPGNDPEADMDRDEYIVPIAVDIAPGFEDEASPRMGR